MARTAKPGERIVTFQGGKITTDCTVEDEASMVLKATTNDREEHVLSRSTFEANYDTTGCDLDTSQAGNDYLKVQGFKLYKSKRRIWAYQVTEQDMAFVSTGFFRASYASTLVSLHLGDFLATGYPDEMATDVYKIAAVTLSQAYSPLPEDRSQEEMCSHFLPIMKRHGTVRRKVVGCMARCAQEGEETAAVEGFDQRDICGCRENAEGTANRMIIKALTRDREEYVLDREIFELNYEVDGCDIDTQQPGNQFLFERGFRIYKSKRKIWSYLVTDEDMKAVPTGLFWARWGISPVPLKPGDYLATGYPDEYATEVYVISASTLAQTYEALPEDCSQEFMCAHFIPIIKEKGEIMCKIVGSLARPAICGEKIITVEDGHVTSEQVVEEGSSQMVVKALTDEREEYLLDRDVFESNYEIEGQPLDPKQVSNAYLASKGFSLHKSKRRAFAYAVTAADIAALPTGFFWQSFGSAPVQLRPGDYLLTGCWEPVEVYRVHSHVLQQTYAPERLNCEASAPVRVQDGVFTAYLPSQAELVSKMHSVMLERGSSFRKTTKAFLRPAIKGEVIETVFDGKVETTNKANAGDWIVRANTSKKERYILSPEKFHAAYDAESCCAITDVDDAEQLTAEGFQCYTPKMRIVAMEVTAQDFMLYFPCGQFMASWGQPMLVEESDFIAGAPVSDEPENGFKEIYRIERSAFFQTYTRV